DGEHGRQGPSLARMHLVAFTAVAGDRAREVRRQGDGLAWASTLEDRKGQELVVGLRLAAEPLRARAHEGAAAGVDARAGRALAGTVVGALRSEGRAEPDWGLTPFVEPWASRAGDVLGDLGLPGVSERGWAHLAVGVPLAELSEGRGVAFVCTVEPGLGAVAPSGAPGEDVAAPDEDPAPGVGASDAGTSAADPRASAAGWRSVLAGYPRFTSSSPHLTRYFDYRVYGLHLNRIQGGRGRIPHACVAEGIEYFHLPITYSAQCHMWETRWSSDPETARGSLLNFLAAQREDGSLPGRLYVNHCVQEDFDHANWADAVLAVDALHPDRAFLERGYAGLSRFAGWLARERDPEGSGMITVVNHYETGQEYMSRYLAVDPDSDVTEWEPRLRLKGVDVTVYAYQLLRGLSAMADRLGDDKGAARWDAAAERTGRAILGEMWDEDSGLFSDVDGTRGRRTGVKAAVCFYPLLSDLLDDARVHRLLGHLQDPATFATPFPVPSSAADDAFFDPDGLWKGKRHNCPWNGRVWPMTNSHVVEGLLRQWHRGRAAAGPVAAHVLERFVRMMFHGQDPERANCYEHYNPHSGHACVFRGIDDYQHSWVLDLIARGAAGVEPGPRALRVHPLPMGLEHARFQGTLRGRSVGVRVTGDAVRLELDGAVHETEVGRGLEVPW
ncbi:MAG TPA: trehalase family glycosidase, partial [Longimicrobiales bacterium]|nr:trehalase family glycosidase [Longimicrobiales bacterium]